MSKRRKRSYKWISWVLFLVLLIGAAIVVFLVRDSIFGEKKEEPTIEAENIVIEQNDSIKEEPKIEAEAPQPEKEEVVSYDGDNPNKEDDLTGVVTYAGIVDEVLMIRVNIDQFLSQGTCKLVLEKDGATRHEEMAQIVDSAATATCEGFNVSAGTLEGGNYKIIIKLESGEKNGIINGEVSL